jgi:hypothetical protein
LNERQFSPVHPVCLLAHENSVIFAPFRTCAVGFKEILAIEGLVLEGLGPGPLCKCFLSPALFTIYKFSQSAVDSRNTTRRSCCVLALDCSHSVVFSESLRLRPSLIAPGTVVKVRPTVWRL